MSDTSNEPGARYVLMRYERCSRCAQALTVDVVVDPATHHYLIHPGVCPSCTTTTSSRS
jgi:hypothetical protein